MTFNDYCCKITLNRDIAAYHNYLLVEILYFPEKKKQKKTTPKSGSHLVTLPLPAHPWAFGVTREEHWEWRLGLVMADVITSWKGM